MKSASQWHCLQAGQGNLRGFSEHHSPIFIFQLGCLRQINGWFKSNWSLQLPDTLAAFHIEHTRHREVRQNTLLPILPESLRLDCVPHSHNEHTAVPRYCRAFHRQPCGATFRPNQAGHALSCSPLLHLHSSPSQNHLNQKHGPASDPDWTLLTHSTAKGNWRFCPLSVLGY